MNLSDSPHGSEYEAAMNALQPGWLAGNGRYTLVRLLGKSGVGTVWLAKDEQLQEEVALKFLPPAIGLNAAALDDLKRETLRARKLTHPNIVRIHDFFQGAHEAVISMEFVDGANLEALRLERPNQVFEWRDLYSLVLQLCEALDYAHKEGMIHGNIGPGSLMINGKEKLKVTGFGFSMPLADAPEHVAQRNDANSYLSPSRLAGEPPCVADDIYALGATIYELLAGRPPFDEDEILQPLHNRRPRSLRDVVGEGGDKDSIPNSVNALVLACLARDPVQRPQSAGLIAETLRMPDLANPLPDIGDFTTGKNPESSDHHDEFRSTPEPTSVPGERPALPILPTVENWPASETQAAAVAPRRGYGLVVAAAFVGVVILSVIIFLVWNRAHKSEETETLPDTGSVDMEKADSQTVAPASSDAQQPTSQPTAQPPGVKYESADFVVSGARFSVKTFDEHARAFSNRKYFWTQTPTKFRGWNFTQTSYEKRAQIHLRALRDADVFVATAFRKNTKSAEIVLPGWQLEGSTFIYSTQTRMVMFRKHLAAGQELDVPPGGKYSVVLLFQK